MSITVAKRREERAMASPNSNIDYGYQNIFVMRHGDRIDNFEPLWVSTAERPWDPPLVQDGMIRAFRTGQRIRSQIGFPIHRVFVSPFVRCIQTAYEVIAALSAVNVDPNAMSSKDVPSIDKSKLKVRSWPYNLNSNSPKIRVFCWNFKSFMFRIVCWAELWAEMCILLNRLQLNLVCVRCWTQWL